MVDIIIPVFNEETFLYRNGDYYRELSKKAHLIFVDGGSTDKTISLAKQYGNVIQTQKGRSLQKNRGVLSAESNYLLFLHIDTKIEYRSLEMIENLLAKGVKGGCFTLTIDDGRLIFRIFERLVNFCAKTFHYIDGDLGQFVTKEEFLNLGGFDNVAIMEDILFGKKLAQKNRFTILPETIKASSRKWDEKGFCKLLVEYTRAYARYFIGRLKPRFCIKKFFSTTNNRRKSSGKIDRFLSRYR